VTLALTEKKLVPNTNFVVQPELAPGKPTAIRVFFSAQL
jgi:hypothetical protein